MDVQLSRMCVSASEVNANVESWILKHFSCGSSWKDDKCSISKSNVEYHKRYYLNERLYCILHHIEVANVSMYLNQLREMEIYTRENIDIFLDFILDAVSRDTNCAVPYARLCHEIAIEQGSQFKQALCKKCLQLFEKKSLGYTERRLKMREIKTYNEASKIASLKLELEQYNNQLRSEYTKFIHFIGELFLNQLLSNNVIVNYIHGLLSRRDDEGLECACLLLSRVGGLLETSGCGLHQIFYILQSFVNCSNQGNVSYRVWNMANELLALRSSHWLKNTN
ncbi:eukaryotic translation initiation factor 4 gamma 1-like [Photinus pyralis]|uniref:MIF4G domain-containing protein n=1 Tax=Photinus pyralis TaxID=7054 RepID=A0A1Y1NFW2_PHOPY|nr:eukaryotic translation initiation factor 4 gamma 1-like [Photinus pyralis]